MKSLASGWSVHTRRGVLILVSLGSRQSMQIRDLGGWEGKNASILSYKSKRILTKTSNSLVCLDSSCIGYENGNGRRSPRASVWEASFVGLNSIYDLLALRLDWRSTAFLNFLEKLGFAAKCQEYRPFLRVIQDYKAEISIVSSFHKLLLLKSSV